MIGRFSQTNYWLLTLNLFSLLYASICDLGTQGYLHATKWPALGENGYMYMYS